MNKFPRIGASILLAFLFGPVAAQAPAPATAPATTDTAQSKNANDRDARREEMRREVDEAARAIGAYSQAERDQALQRAKSALDAMDRRIEAARRSWESEAERMTATARERRERAMADLRTQRAEAAERYRAMQDASADTWGRVREQFVASYQSLAERVRRLWDSANEPSPAEGKPDQPAEQEESDKKDG